MANLWLVLKAVLVLIPFIVDLIKENKIKTATEKEVLDAFEAEFKKRFDKRIADAAAAADAAKLPDNDTFEGDPNDRNRNRK